MNLTRRDFFKSSRNGAVMLIAARAGLAIGLGGTAMTFAGCNVITDIENWAPTGEAAVNAILALLTANGILLPPGVSAIVALIEGGFNALVAAAKEYQSTNPPPVGALAKIEAAFQSITDQFSAFVTQLSPVAGKVLAIVIALVKIVISTIGGFINKLPAGASMLARVTMGTPVAAAPVVRTNGRFKKDFNQQMAAAAAQGLNCPDSAYLKLSFFEKF